MPMCCVMKYTHCIAGAYRWKKKQTANHLDKPNCFLDFYIRQKHSYFVDRLLDKKQASKTK